VSVTEPPVQNVVGPDAVTPGVSVAATVTLREPAGDTQPFEFVSTTLSVIGEIVPTEKVIDDVPWPPVITAFDAVQL
jgi:hypothetical protein